MDKLTVNYKYITGKLQLHYKQITAKLPENYSNLWVNYLICLYSVIYLYFTCN